ncbi:MAG: prenyltransferase [Actinobacteria bacterium]|nr:prenyltransferase [Actinomycetota bacterium]
MLSPAERAATALTIVADQQPDGLILWSPGGHADPWNHVEAAMALSLLEHRVEAERAYEWLARNQHRDGAWFNYYWADRVKDERRDTNVIAYAAVGVWHHFLLHKDTAFLEDMFAMVDAAIRYVLDLQQDTGEVLWCREPDGVTPGEYGLLTGSSSIYLSLRCAIAIAERVGDERPDWELAAGSLAHAIRRRPEVFADKSRWAMDWYYPVLCGALTGSDGRARLRDGWNEFVMPERGVRCVADRPWVTAAETAECVMALDAAGLDVEARTLFDWVQRYRYHDGAYWTGCVYPNGEYFPGDERSSYTAAAVLLADEALDGVSPTAGLFRGEGLPAGLDLSDGEEPATSRFR